MRKLHHRSEKAVIRAIARPKRLLFKIISGLFPFLLLLLIELGLRLFHYGNSFDLFIESPENKDYYVMNPAASRRYFMDPNMATIGNHELFQKQKSPQTIRLFVLGESTTIGYPYFHNGSFHRWLQYRLMRSFPDKTIEVINLSLTAVNSYTILGFAKAIIPYAPDAVLIYSGQNEYYGALGVGSTENLGNNPLLVNLLLRLRQLRLIQLLGNVYQTLRQTFGNTQSLSGESRMELMAAQQQITYKSPLYEKGITQFRFNMERTLALLEKHHIPVFLSNLVSNEKDLKPFVSLHPKDSKLPEFKKWYQRGEQAFQQKNTDLAYTAFKAAAQLYPSDATCQYYLGKTALLKGDVQEAFHYFSLAKDLDGLRFRAPEELNEVISQLCQQFSNVQLVDTKSLFQAKSQAGIIGDELILEHVHPNLWGYALLSEAFYQSMEKAKLFASQKDEVLSFQQLLQDMPVLKTDSLAGMYKIAKLKKSWHFHEALNASVDTGSSPSFESKLAQDMLDKKLDWYTVNERLFQYYLQQERYADARKVAAGLTLEYPTDASYYEKTAMLSGKLNEREQVRFYMGKAFSLSPSFDKARYLFVICLQLDRPEEALPYLDYAIANNRSNFNLQSIKASTLRIIQLKAAYAKKTGDKTPLKQIAELYQKMENTEAASKYQKLLMLSAPPSN